MQSRLLWLAGMIPAMLAALLLATPVPAATQVGIAIFAGRHTYAMDDVNDELIEPINVILAPMGLEMDEITGGWGFGAGLRIQPMEKVLVALDYERLTASSTLSAFDGSFEVDVPANAFTGTVTYFFPASSKSRFGIGAGMGYYRSAGSIAADSSGSRVELDVDGSGIGFHGVGAVDVGISPNVHFQAVAGYRVAETSDVEVGGETQYRSNGEEATLDWTGFMSRAGLTFYIGQR